jgi:DNA-binding response OmpR family regulator
VLLLEGHPSSESLLSEAVRAEIPGAEITRTGGVLGALALAELYPYDLLIVDAPLRSDVEKELAAEFQKLNPKAEVILACTDASRARRRHGKASASRHFLNAPINPLELIETIRGCRDRAALPVTEVDPEEEGYFVVVLSRHTPVEVVQLKCLSGATTALDFIRRDGRVGRVWFSRGEIIHAEAGATRGEDALIEMINWQSGSIVEVSVPSPQEETIHECWTTLLMRAVHAADERRSLGVSV